MITTSFLSKIKNSSRITGQNDGGLKTFDWINSVEIDNENNLYVIDQGKTK